ncbi:MAG TPA: IS66 family transposase [Casimicrobiaceae bacterium]|nr:IS66 family transposase [Casimicrobiaceae bacterium]
MTPPPDFSSLSSAEKDALIGTLLARIDALIAENAALRERLNLPPKTPENSSTPPSQGHKASGESETKPKAKTHAGSHRPLHPNPTQRRDVLADRCEHCRADVSAVPQVAVHAYDRIEIPEIVPDVTRVTLHGGFCPCCRRRFRAAPPAGLASGSPFGPNLRAFVLYLRFAQAIPFERLARLMSDLLGLQISEGALANMLEASGGAFARQSSLIRDRLLSGTILQSDETSARVGKKTWWTWVFHNGDSACFLIRPSRGKAVVGEFLGAVRPDFWVSDRLGAQMGWARTGHQACLAHLLRDVQYAIDAGDVSFAPGIKNLLKQAVAIGHRRASLAASTLAVYAAKLEAKLDRLLQIEPANWQGQKLLRIIKKYRQNLFVFVTNLALPPTNNGSEQALRPCVIFRKITNCFRSQWGAKLYADVRSVFETARRRGIPILQSIRLTLDERPLPVAT